MMIDVTVRLFATLRQQAGWSEKSLQLDDEATLADLLSLLEAGESTMQLSGRPVYAAVNQEYAEPSHVLQHNDTVAIFPPVSGGEEKSDQVKLFEITDTKLSIDDAAERVSRVSAGGIAAFSGIVRGETQTGDGSRGTDFLVYEAYTEMAEKKMAQIGDEIMQRWPKVEAVCILHRIGRCEVGESSVVISVSTPHRNDGCFEACRYAIERLKAIVPIWKQENWSDGQVWVEGPRQEELDVSQKSSS